MTIALYLNGVFEKVLEEIQDAQSQSPNVVCFLQPYALDRIKLLADSPPDDNSPVRLYISLTDSLEVVSYRALIVGWQDKRALTTFQLQELNQLIAANQPGEKQVHLKTPEGEDYVNLISVRALQRLEHPVAVSAFVKTSDETPLKTRTRAGGWSYVYELPDWVGMVPNVEIRERTDSVLTLGVAESLKASHTARQERLTKAPRFPEQIEVISREYRRNPDVIAEVLIRADGKCESCKTPAPFLRPDGTPYLEVHHRVLLAKGGEDSVKNAMAVCPNCHRRLHFGVPQDGEV
jgi:5-methylcytosine-specific restriction enzyme A